MEHLKSFRQTLIEFKTPEVQGQFGSVSMNDLDAMVGFDRPELKKIITRPELGAIQRLVFEILTAKKDFYKFVSEYTDIMKMPNFNHEEFLNIQSKYNKSKIQGVKFSEICADLKYIVYYLMIYKIDFPIIKTSKYWLEDEFLQNGYKAQDDEVIDIFKRIVYAIRNKNPLEFIKNIINIENGSSHFYANHLYKLGNGEGKQE